MESLPAKAGVSECVEFTYTSYQRFPLCYVVFTRKRFSHGSIYRI